MAVRERDDDDNDPGELDEGVTRTVSRKAEVKDDEPPRRKTKEEQDEEAREAERRSRDNPNPGVPAVEGAEDAEPEKKAPEKDPKDDRHESADRARRRRQREAKERDKTLIREQGETIAELQKRLEKLEGHQTEQDKARLGDTLENTRAALADLRTRRKQAIKDLDADAVDTLDDAIYKLRRQEEDLSTMARKAGGDGKPKEKVEERTERRAPTPEEREAADKVANFMEDHDWIQIGKDGEGQDRDSRKALAIDREMWNEGWRPTDADWEAEFTARLKEALPNRFEDPGNESETRREPRRGPPTGGRGREGTSRGNGAIQFKLTDVHKRALAEAGLTQTDPEGRRIIRKWVEEHEAQARR